MLDAPFGWLHPLGKLLVRKTGMAQVVAKVSKKPSDPVVSGWVLGLL